MSLLTNLVSYWKLDETSGNRADSHGSSTLTDNNTVGNATGIINNGADFIDTNTEWLSTADTNDFSYTGAENRSISFWFKTDSVTGVNTLVSKWANPTGSSTQEYIVYLSGTSLILGVLTQGALVTKTSIATGTWYHVVVTMNSSKGVEMFVNNVSAGTATSTGSIATTTSEFYLGRNSTTNYYDGVIDEVGFWTKILTSGEISDLYNGGAGFAYPFSSAGATLAWITA